MLKLKVRSIKKSLAGRLSGRIVVVAVILGFVFGLWQISLDINHEQAQTKKNIDNIVDTITPLAALAAYELNQQTANEVLIALTAYKPIVNAEIFRENGESLAKIKTASPNSTNGIFFNWIYEDIEELTISLFHDNFTGTVGRLTLKFSPDILAQGVSRRTGITIALGILMNVLAALIIILVIDAFLTRPVVSLSRNLKSLGLVKGNPDFLDVPKSHEDDELGQLVQAINSYISEAKEAETKLRQSQKMEAVGQLTSGIAHDFNNLLGIIIGNTELLRPKVADDPSILNHIEALKKATARASTLTDHLVAFSRQQVLSPVPTDILSLILMLEDVLRRKLGDKVDLKIQNSKEISLAMIDPTQFEQALINLIVNSREAMPKGGRLTIDVSNVFFDENNAQKHEDVMPGKFVKVSISDTGVGISPEALERIYDPFYTTKDTGKGSGVGLSMVYGFTKQSKGHLSIDSKEGSGTTANLYLPQSDKITG